MYDKNFETACGKIRFPLSGDAAFHLVMCRSKNALKGLTCSLLNLSADDVNDILIQNPIDIRDINSKEIILDVKLLLNNSEILNIELQMYYDEDWLERSLLYLCRDYDNIISGQQYNSIKSSTFVAISNRSYFSKHPKEFYSRFQLLNLRHHYSYTGKFNLNMLYLNRIEYATQEDIRSGLVYWAKLFKATTWEELRFLSKDNPVAKEVSIMLYQLNAEEKERVLLEAHEKFVDMQRALYRSGYKKAKQEAESIIASKDAEIASLKAQLATLQRSN